MAQHVLPAAQLVPQYKPIGRCNNYAVLHSIPCSPECKIRTVSKVPDIEDTIKFMLDTQQFTYTVDMFRDTLYLLVETPENPFVAPANINTIKVFMNRVGYQGVVDKDDVPLVSVYITGNVSVRGMLIPNAFLTAEIRETNDFKEYKTVFMKVDVLMNQLQLDASTQGTHRITPSAHRSPIVFASPPVSKKRKQIARESSSLQQSLKITIKKKQTVKKNNDDSEDRIEPRSHKDNPEVVVDDNDKEIEKQDDEMGSLEIRNEETHTTIPTPLSSPRKILSSDKKTFQELTNIVSNPTTSTSKHSQVKKRISKKYSNLPGALRRMCRRQVPDFVSKEFKAHAPAIIEELFKNNVQSNVIHVHRTTTTSTKTESSTDLWYQLYLKMKRNIQDRADDIAHHRLLTLCSHPSTPPLPHIPGNTGFTNVDKRVSTIFDHARMEATLRDSLSNMSKNAEEYAYHLEQSTSFMEN
ncbi:hypothetical protein Tco_0886899 [Tanacetum coccineum]